MDTNEIKKQRRGFALLSPERRSEIARMGGQHVQAYGNPHRFTSEEGKSAGRKGGGKMHKSYIEKHSTETI